VVRELGLKKLLWADTAGGGRDVGDLGGKKPGARASQMGPGGAHLTHLKAHKQEGSPKERRFFIMSAETPKAEPNGAPVITSFIFRVRNVPAALYKALGGFATNGVNLTKLESYQLEGSFSATQFYADIDGHPEERNVQLALEELQFFTSSLKI